MKRKSNTKNCKSCKKNKRKNTCKKRKNTTCKKGGIRYGTGYGSNCNQPNYSIFNTNLLKLFPYKA